MTPYLRYSRGCYLQISDKGNFKEVLREYAEAELEKDAAGPLVAVKGWALSFSRHGSLLECFIGIMGNWASEILSTSH